MKSQQQQQQQQQQIQHPQQICSASYLACYVNVNNTGLFKHQGL